MYIYDRELSGAQSVLTDQSTESLFRSYLSGNVKFGAAEVRKPSATNEQLPGWLQEGVRRGRWTQQTASGLWALRKISKG